MQRCVFQFPQLYEIFPRDYPTKKRCDFQPCPAVSAFPRDCSLEKRSVFKLFQLFQCFPETTPGKNDVVQHSPAFP
eukprot:4753718-Pyramimonas_sp.AAC.1